jgi:hypothetical protein
MAGRSSPGQNVTVDVLPGEPHLHPCTGHAKIGHRGRHEVLKGAIQVSKPNIYQDQGDRIDRGGR